MFRTVRVSWRRLAWLILLAGVSSLQISGQRAGYQASAKDWPQFGYDPASSSAPAGWAGITASNVALMTRQQVRLDGTVDASAIYLHSVTVNGSSHDVFFVTTSYGETIAVDADSGAILWEYSPPGAASLAGSAQITNSTPAADPDRQHIYAAAPDGTVEKLAIANGNALWSTAITLLPSREKIASPLKIFNGHVIAVTGGYIGDAPPYQGHVAVLDAQSGALLSVWNSLCGNRAGLIQPSSCSSTRSAIWGRAGAVIDAATGDIFVATGNGPYDGKTNWGDALIELDPGASQVLGNYTPADNASLEGSDLDLGSTSPALVGAGVVAQGGKDMLVRTLSIPAIAGTAGHVGGELQSVSTPSKSMLFTALAVWRNQGQTWLFGADGGATTAWTIGSGGFTQMWSHATGGTSPVEADGLAYVYNPGGGLRVYEAASGTQIANLTCGGGHWNSPVVADGRIALPEGNANGHASSGVLDIWSLPARRGTAPGKK